MDNILNRRQIADGVYFSKITDERYKKNIISVRFFETADDATATDNVIVPNILSKSSGRYPTYKQLQNKLSVLYAASVSGVSTMVHDLHCNGLSAYYLDDVYALSGEKMTEEITDILIDCLFNPVLENGVFPEKTVALEKQTVIDEIEALINDKRAYAADKAVEIMCKGEPAAVKSKGTVERAKALTPADAYAAYERLLHNTHCEILCVGCNDFSVVEEKMKEAFSKISRTGINEYSIKKSPIKESTEEVVEKMSVTQSKMVIGFKSHLEDTAALIMLQKIYGGTTTSKLFMNVREKMSLCYYCSASYNPEKGLIPVQCGVENANIEKAREEIIRQLDEIKNGNFTDEDITFAEMSVKNSYKSVNDSASGVLGWYFNRIIIDDIITPEEAVEKYIGISRERIIAAAKSLVLDTVYILTSQD